MTCLANIVTGSLKQRHDAARPPNPLPLPAVLLSPIDGPLSGTLEADICSALSCLDVNDRKVWIDVGQRLKKFPGGKEIWLRWSALSAKFDLGKDEKTWETFSADLTGYAAIFADAQRKGWINPSGGYGSELPAIDLQNVTCGGQPIIAGIANPATVPASIISEPPGIGEWEWHTAKATPDVVVANLYHSDVGVFLAAGGAGKTTLILYIMICLVLGDPVFGMNVIKSGPVVFITGEDSRETLIARLRSIAHSMNLTREQIIIVATNIRISDESGSGFKLTEVQRDVVKPTAGVDHLIACLTNLKPVMVVVDPAVSFGVGESRVNDAEQGLIEAGRKMRNALNCCVLYIHHTGKANSRDQSWDQYAGRGGSAFSDGARMVHVMHPLTPQEFYKATGVNLEPGESGLGFARPKMTFCPVQPIIYIKRQGFKFERIERQTIDLAAKVEGHSAKIIEILTDDLTAGKKHSRNSLEALDHGIKRADLRAAINWLIKAGRIEEQLLDNGGRGGQNKYLRPVPPPRITGEPMPTGGYLARRPMHSLVRRRPIGKVALANLNSPSHTLFSIGSPARLGEALARLAKQSPEKHRPP